MSIPSLSRKPRTTASRQTSEKSFFSARARLARVTFSARVILTVLVTAWPCMRICNTFMYSSVKRPAADLGRTLHAHPTVSESLKEAALAVSKSAIHAL